MTLMNKEEEQHNTKTLNMMINSKEFIRIINSFRIDKNRSIHYVNKQLSNQDLLSNNFIRKKMTFIKMLKNHFYKRFQKPAIQTIKHLDKTLDNRVIEEELSLINKLIIKKIEIIQSKSLTKIMRQIN
jgi:hypothetical protein